MKIDKFNLYLFIKKYLYKIYLELKIFYPKDWY